MTTSRPVEGKRYGILNHEGGKRFYYRSVAPEARLKKKKARKQARKSKRRNP
ncbi:hypothetical protein LCGC14_1761100 [marine sediment metagenome]|uniref:Uncharacterized protein n=1 Tax=marine sediment metagenome TaxID=412755 RepID=A0A0F9HNG6_9ZZZZ